MKIIHAADIHLGSKLDSKFPKEKSDMRKKEVRDTFRRMIEYAKRNDIHIILLAGDIFDSDTPAIKDKEFFYSVIRNNKDIDFLYLRGNHDKEENNSISNDSNLKCFNTSWNSYKYDNVNISGIEMNDTNYETLYNTLDLKEDMINIVMLHGQISDNVGQDKICLKKLKGKYIDYLALGHIHKKYEGSLDERGTYCYSGCLEGRGFDEVGEHGFYVLDINNNDIKRTFVDFAYRTIHEVDVDITDKKDSYEISEEIKRKVNFNKNDIYRINLVGDIDINLEDFVEDVEHLLEDQAFFINCKDKTNKKINVDDYLNDTSLKGQFVRLVKNDESYASYKEEEKNKIIYYGLKALEGRKFDS